MVYYNGTFMGAGKTHTHEGPNENLGLPFITFIVLATISSHCDNIPFTRVTDEHCDTVTTKSDVEREVSAPTVKCFLVKPCCSKRWRLKC